MIKLNKVSKSYGKIRAIKDISFEIEPENIVGFIGSNGSGKSTTMNIMTGCFAPDLGRVTIDDFDMIDNPLKAKALIGYLPEQPPVYPYFTVEEYLDAVYKIKRIKMDRKKHIAEIINLTGLEEVSKRRIGNLSKGYCQRVALAQALVGYPRYLILDEPTVGLDPKQKTEILELIKRIGKGRGIILSSHILSEIDKVCNKLLIIDKGQIIRSGNKAEVLSEKSEHTALALEYKIKGSVDIVRKLFASYDGVMKVKECKAVSDTVCYISAILKNDSAAADIFYMLANERMPIVSLKSYGDNIENVFIKLSEKHK